MKVILILSGLLFGLIFPSKAKMLTSNELKNCREIAIIPGTFDPITAGHLSMGPRIIENTTADCVVFLPTINTPHKKPLPYRIRLALLEKALFNNEEIFYPDKKYVRLGTTKYLKSLKEINPNIKITAVLGSDLSQSAVSYYLNKYRLHPDKFLFLSRDDEDVKIHKAFEHIPHEVLSDQSVINVSSSKVRKWLKENPLIYTNDDFSMTLFDKSLLNINVYQEIRKRGLYFSTDTETTLSIKQAIFHFLDKRIKKMQFLTTNQLHSFRRLISKRLTEFRFEDNKITNLKMIDYSKNIEHFTFNHNELGFRLIHSTLRKDSKEQILNSLLNQTYIDHNEIIPTKSSYAFDPSGKWVVYKVQEDEQLLVDYLKNTNGVIDNEIRNQLETLIKSSHNYSNNSNIKLNLSAKNIIIKNKKVTLLSTIALDQSEELLLNYDQYFSLWNYESFKGKRPMIKQECFKLFQSVFR